MDRQAIAQRLADATKTAYLLYLEMIEEEFANSKSFGVYDSFFCVQFVNGKGIACVDDLRKWQMFRFAKRSTANAFLARLGDDLQKALCPEFLVTK